MSYPQTFHIPNVSSSATIQIPWMKIASKNLSLFPTSGAHLAHTPILFFDWLSLLNFPGTNVSNLLTILSASSGVRIIRGVGGVEGVLFTLGKLRGSLFTIGKLLFTLGKLEPER
jgi:hypothetical protein